MGNSIHSLDQKILHDLAKKDSNSIKIHVEQLNKMIEQNGFKKLTDQERTEFNDTILKVLSDPFAKEPTNFSVIQSILSLSLAHLDTKILKDIEGKDKTAIITHLGELDEIVNYREKSDLEQQLLNKIIQKVLQEPVFREESNANIIELAVSLPIDSIFIADDVKVCHSIINQYSIAKHPNMITNVTKKFPKDATLESMVSIYKSIIDQYIANHSAAEDSKTPLLPIEPLDSVLSALGRHRTNEKFDYWSTVCLDCVKDLGHYQDKDLMNKSLAANAGDIWVIIRELLIDIILDSDKYVGSVVRKTIQELNEGKFWNQIKMNDPAVASQCNPKKIYSTKSGTRSKQLTDCIAHNTSFGAEYIEAVQQSLERGKMEEILASAERNRTETERQTQFLVNLLKK